MKFEGIYAIVMKTKSQIRNWPGEHTTNKHNTNTNEVRKAPGTQGVALQDFKASTAPATKLSCQDIWKISRSWKKAHDAK